MIVVVMGVTGTGKSSVGERLAQALHVPFTDGDDFHDPANIMKMRRAEPLTDVDRAPWLDRLNRELRRHEQTGVVLACSALNSWSRRRLTAGVCGVRFVFLHGDEEVLRQRLRKRKGHFAGVDLLDSQLDALEEPEEVIAIDVDDTIDAVVAKTLAGLRSESSSLG